MKICKMLRKILCRRKDRVLHRKNGSSMRFKQLALIIILFSSSLSVFVPTMPANPPMDNGYLVIGRGFNWNEYLVDGKPMREIASKPINYFDGESYQPIDTTFEILSSNHPAYSYGYRAGVEQAPFNTYFKPNAQDEWCVAFCYEKDIDPTLHVLRSKLLAVGYYDPSTNHQYETIQTVLNSQGTITGNTGTYPNVFTGTDAKWTIIPQGIKEELILSNTTKTVLQNNPPSDYGLSNQNSYLVIATKLDYQNLNAYNGTEQTNDNFTADKILFKDVIGDIKAVFPIGFAYEHNGTAHDITYRLLQYNNNYFLLAGIKVTTLNAMSFPVTIDPSIHVDTTLSDAYVAQYNQPVYNTAWTASTGTVTNGSYLVIGQSDHSNYQIYRGAVFFNTSSLPDTCTVASANIALRCHHNNTNKSYDDFFIVAQQDLAGTSPHNPVVAVDYNKVNYSGDLGSVNTDALDISGNAGVAWINLTLNSTGLANISKTGITKFMLRSNKDILGSAPTDREYVEFNGSGFASIYVNYSSKPVVTTNASTNDNSTYSIFNGYLSDEGGATTTCGFRWDFNGATGGWDNNRTVGTVADGATYLLNNTNLSAGKLYIFQAWANNTYGFGIGSETTVLTRPNATTGMGLSVTAIGIQASWTHGNGYNTSVLVVNTTGSADYPHNPTDGTILYNGTGTNYHHTPLVINTTYYYSIWEYTTWTYNATTSHKFSHLNQTSSTKYETFEITVNATKGITAYNATFQGYIPAFGFTGNYNYGFWVGQTSPVTEATADYNFTNATVVAPMTNFTFNGSISSGVKYYVKGWIDNGSYFNTSYNEVNFTSRPIVPTTFTATRDGDNVNLVWTKAGDYNTTILRKNGSYATTPQDATALIVYNGSASSYVDTAQKGHRIYYRAWAWFGENYSDNWIDDNLNITPDPPSGVAGTVLSNGTLNISWTNGTGVRRTVIRRGVGSYPANPQSGTETYNGTGSYNFEGTVTQSYYYRLWSFAEELFSTAVDASYGALVINCYDEKTNNSLNFDVFVSNISGSESYEANNCSNTHMVNINDCPTGTQTSIHISAVQSYDNLTANITGYAVSQNESYTYIQLEYAPKNKSSTNLTCTLLGNSYYPEFLLSGDQITLLPDACPSFDGINISYVHEKYRDRFYYFDLYRNNIYLLNSYLPWSDDSNLYYVTVKDRVERTVDDAKITIKKYITDKFKNISVSYTDSNGQTGIFLMPSEYIVIIEKSGYETLETQWIPDPDYSGILNPKYFYLEFETEEYPSEEPETEGITFTGYINRITNILYINYSDNRNQTTDTQIYVYEYNYSTGTTILFGSNLTTNNNDFQATFININNNNRYTVVLYYNHTYWGTQVKTIIFERERTTITNESRVNTLFELNYGLNPFGWSNSFLWIFAVMVYFGGGQQEAGFMMIVLGILMFLINYVIGFNTTLSVAAGGVLPILHVIIGIMLIWKYSSKQGVAG